MFSVRIGNPDAKEHPKLTELRMYETIERLKNQNKYYEGMILANNRQIKQLEAELYKQKETESA